MRDGSLNVRIEGEGEPAFVLVHGFNCSLEDWEPLVAILSARHRCIALDLPGHGRSPLPAQASIATLAEAVNEVRREHASGDVVLVGHSMGAKVIREACVQLPDGVAGLVLIDGVIYPGDCEALAATMRAKIDAMGFADFAREHFDAMFQAGFPETRRRAMIDRAMRQDPDFARALYFDAIMFDQTRGLETIRSVTAPMLVLQSTEVRLPDGRQSLVDGDVTPLMRAVCELTPRGSAKIIPGVGHFTMIDAPAHVAREIEKFAGELG